MGMFDRLAPVAFGFRRRRRPDRRLQLVSGDPDSGAKNRPASAGERSDGVPSDPVWKLSGLGIVWGDAVSQSKSLFSKFATAVSDLSGKPLTFVVAFLLVLAWAITGPMFNYSETWQLVINTSTTIVTFLMVFVLQNSQNRDGKALQAKLDELILTSKASNKFVGVEKLDERELLQMSKDCSAEAAVAIDELGERAKHPKVKLRTMPKTS
jgi:low affinity Fe/Cu permease